MRILVCTHSRSRLGGAEAYLHSLLPALLGAGHAVALCVEWDHGLVATIDDPERRIPVWCESATGRTALLAEVDRWRPDVLYDNGLHDVGLQRALLGRSPGVFFGHAFHGTCISGQKHHRFPGVQACHRALGPGCLALYLPRRCGGLNPVEGLRLYRLQQERLRVLHEYRALVVASGFMRDEYVRNGLALGSMHVLPLYAPGVLRPTELPATRFGSGRVTFIGRMTRNKGLDRLIQSLPIASAQLGRPLRLVAAGDGEDRDACARLASRLGVSLELPGWIDAAAKQTLLASTELIALPSVWPEPLGLVGLEALAFGVPAVAFETGGVGEWLVPSVTGGLAPSVGDPLALAEAITGVLGAEETYEQMRQAAWARGGTFSVEQHLQALTPVLEGLVRD